jgi:hypothetical protein
VRDNAGTTPYSVYSAGGASTREAQLSPEVRQRRAWYATPLGDGMFIAEHLGAQNRNKVYASAVLTIPAAAASGTVETGLLVLDVNQDLPLYLAVFVWNGSDASLSLTVNNAMLVGTTTEYVPVTGVNALAVPAGSGLFVVAQGIGLGDSSPQAYVKTTSAATNGGNVTVQLRFI